MSKISAGILVYRQKNNQIQILLVKSGGPFFKYKKRSWSIPKGEVKENETPPQTALREFEEETGLILQEPFELLGNVKSKSGKEFICFFVKKDYGFDSMKPIKPLMISLKLSKNKIVTFPEIEKIAYWDLTEARQIIFEYQLPLLNELLKKINL